MSEIKGTWLMVGLCAQALYRRIVVESSSLSQHVFDNHHDHLYILTSMRIVETFMQLKDYL